MEKDKSINIITTNHCQLRCNFCLNSKLDANFPIESLSYDTFVKTIDKLITFGFNTFDLTPNIGDIFLDKDIYNKLTYFENHERVKHYEFVSNFLALDEIGIKQIHCTQKCECAISIYGFDEKSYQETTGVNCFRKFHQNFKKLYGLCKETKNSDAFMFYMRYSALEDFPDSEIKEMLIKMLEWGAELENAELVNRNWGGLMLDNKCKKIGICSRLLKENGVYPNGDITACNCWDWNKELDRLLYRL